MPELPEVETVRRGLIDHLVGRTVTAVEVLHPRATRRQRDDSDFAQFAGQLVIDIRRRGKYLWFALGSGDAVIAHLGMSGQFRFVQPGTPDHPHLRIRLQLDGPAQPDWPAPDQPDQRPAATKEQTDEPREARALGWSEQLDGRGAPPRSSEGEAFGARSAGQERSSECWFLDQRTFGGMQLSPGGADLPGEIGHIGRDLLDPELDRAAVVAAIRRKHVGIKRVLLDQTVTSGIGNIYADEALWHAKVHGERLADSLTGATVGGLLDATQWVFTEALAAGGTSFDALYVNVNGESGYFDRSLKAYGQTDRPCQRCGTAIRRTSFMNRSSHYCPRCQPVPRGSRRLGQHISGGSPGRPGRRTPP